MKVLHLWRASALLVLIALPAATAWTVPTFEYDYASGWPKVCSEETLLFEVTVSGHHENGVYVLPYGVPLEEVDSNEPATAVATFNNYYGRGAGGYWKQGSGDHLAKHTQMTCYLVVARHKRTPPNGSEPLISSHFRFGPDRNDVGFADYADRRYVNATVTVTEP